jgi:hypothetical protein
MIRLHIVAEGQTEKRFVEQVLCGYLGTFNISTDVRCIQTSPGHKGGLLKYSHLKKDLERWMREDQEGDCIFTTMIDLYALPTDFPKYSECYRITEPYAKVNKLENAFDEDIDSNRFIPYIQLHEFETLLLIDLEKIREEYLDGVNQRKYRELQNYLNSVTNVELVNDGSMTAPSKRLGYCITSYDKVYAGANIAKSIGITNLKESCSHFNEWISKLERLV